MLEDTHHGLNLLVADADLLSELLDVLTLIQARAVSRDHVPQPLDLLLVRGCFELSPDLLDPLRCLRSLQVELVDLLRAGALAQTLALGAFGVS